MIKTTKILMAATAFFFTAIAITASIFIEQAKYTTVAFYNVPEEVEIALKPIIQKDSTMIKFKELTEEEYLAPKLNKRVQMVISYNDATTQKLSKKALSLPKSIKEKYPTSIKKSEYYTDHGAMVIQPVLLDQFEIIVLQTLLRRSEIQLPEHFSQLENLARAAKWYYPIPIAISGADDTTINSFLTMMVNLYGGKSAYDDIITKIQKIAKDSGDFSEILDYKIKTTNSQGQSEEITIRILLNLIKDWQVNNYIDAEWYKRTNNHVAKFVDNNVAPIVITNLSEHRLLPDPNIRYYTQIQIPAQTTESRVSIQPAIVALTFKRNDKTKEIQQRLCATQNQEILSDNTKLAPTILAGEAYDSLTANARYLAASTSGGPVPDIGTMALCTQSERHQLAEAIRDYLK